MTNASPNTEMIFFHFLPFSHPSFHLQQWTAAGRKERRRVGLRGQKWKLKGKNARFVVFIFSFVGLEDSIEKRLSIQNEMKVMLMDSNF